MVAVVNRDAVEQITLQEGDIAFRRRRLAAAAGARRIGASHYVVTPGARQMPFHVHGDEEEIYLVLGGGGIGCEAHDAYAVGPGDVVVQRPEGSPHTFIAGDQGLELLAFSSGSDTSITFLPRAGVMWCGPRWVPLDAPHPFRAEGRAGPMERPAVDPAAPRPPHVVALGSLQAGPFPGIEVRAAGHAAGATRAGLNHVTLGPGARGAPPHCHSLEEELFIVLDGAGTVTLGGDDYAVSPFDVIARPPSTGVCHHFTAGPDGLEYLAYGTREPGDAVHYPESGTVRLRGLGITIPLS